jgi:hypothetical protein
LVWKQKYAMLNILVTSFPKLPFFTDATIKKEFRDLCIIGETQFHQFHTLISESMSYKSETVPDEPVNVCTETPLAITGEEIDNEYNRISSRFNLIKDTWTVDEIKNSPDKQSILFEYCSYFNDFSTVYSQRAVSIITALEQLSDGHFPEVLFGNLVRNCSTTINGNGETFEVESCAGNNKGFRCQIIVRQAINLKEYESLVPIHYQGVRITGEKDKNLLARTLDLKEYKYLDCEEDYTDFLVCNEITIPDTCKKSIDTDDTASITKNCNFTKGMPPIITPIPNGGILIQGDETIIVISGETKITNKLPIIVYTPEILKIEAYNEEYYVTPSITVPKLIIVESKLTEDEINALITTENWNNLLSEAEIENYIDIALIILQILLIPMIIIGFYLTIRHGKVLKEIGGKRLRKHHTSENLKSNQQYLLKRIKH